jgi:hypothetical protein
MKLKVDQYSSNKPRGVTVEDWIKQYFEDEIKSVWPPGWMTVKNLEKISKFIISPTPAAADPTAGAASPQKAVSVAIKSTEQLSKPIQPVKLAQPKPAVVNNPISGKPEIPVLKRKLSDNSSIMNSPISKKKAFVDLTVNLVPAIIPVGTPPPGTLRPENTKETHNTGAKNGAKSEVPNQTILKELEKLQHLKQRY